MGQRSVVQIDPRHPRNHRCRSKRLCFPGTPNVVGEESCPTRRSFGPQIVVSAVMLQQEAKTMESRSMGCEILP